MSVNEVFIHHTNYVVNYNLVINYFGHTWVAFQAIKRHDPYLLAGSHIPDLVPYVTNSVFTFDEIHESGDSLYQFLKENHPGCINLALGILRLLNQSYHRPQKSHTQLSLDGGRVVFVPKGGLYLRI